jgi:dTMP kinase
LPQECSTGGQDNDDKIMKNPAELYVFEGPDGVGKSTLSKWFVNILATRNQHPVVWSSFPGNEKGTVGNLVYRLHHDATDLGVKSIHPRSMQLLHIAAHIDAIESRFSEIINSGTSIVLDRFWWSTWVYGRLNGEKASTLEEMIELEITAWGQIKPKMIFLVSRKSSKLVNAHARLTRLYAQLARKQTGTIPVSRIQNNGDIKEAQNQILSSLL